MRGRAASGSLVAPSLPRRAGLGHAAIDRLAPTLPWSADPNDTTLTRISPVEASRRILSHVRARLRRGIAGTAAREPGHRPYSPRVVRRSGPRAHGSRCHGCGSPGPVARGTARRVLRLPVSARHARARNTGRARATAFVLVCDVGGGTTDLTLVRVRTGERGATLDRIAVGRHLLLGGDNMDLALAHVVEPKLVEPPDRLEPALFSSSCSRVGARRSSCSEKTRRKPRPIRILSRGSQLVGFDAFGVARARHRWRRSSSTASSRSSTLTPCPGLRARASSGSVFHTSAILPSRDTPRRSSPDTCRRARRRAPCCSTAACSARPWFDVASSMHSSASPATAQPNCTAPDPGSRRRARRRGLRSRAFGQGTTRRGRLGARLLRGAPFERRPAPRDLRRAARRDRRRTPRRGR